MCFLFGPMDKRNLIHFLKNLIDVTLLLNLHMSQVKLAFHFLILKWAYLTGTFPLICISSPQIDTNFYITHHLILIILNALLFTIQALRISRICSNKSDFLKHLVSMKSSFEVRSYPNKLIEQEMEKVNFFRNGNVLR